MKIGIARPLLGQDEIEQVTRVINSGMIASGPETKTFEKEFADFVESNYACAVNNGTSALSLALSAVGVGPGDEVITSPFTFIATANSILSCGATPVFADIDLNSFNLSPKMAESCISDSTKAIIPIHLYGLPAKMHEFQSLSEEYGLQIIGDAAQAHGAAIGDKKVGSLADVECFSFYPTKNMTTGEGGMVTTNSESIYHRLNSIRNHGRPSSQLGVYEHETFGLNLRLTDIASAIGRVQLSKLPDMNRIRARNASILMEGLRGLEGIILPDFDTNITHSWHQFTIRVQSREELKEFLIEHEIGSGVYYPRVLYDYPHLRKFISNCPKSEEAAKTVISLPVHAGLSDRDVVEVVDRVKEWHSKTH